MPRGEREGRLAPVACDFKCGFDRDDPLWQRLNLPAHLFAVDFRDPGDKWLSCPSVAGPDGAEYDADLGLAFSAKRKWESNDAPACHRPPRLLTPATGLRFSDSAPLSLGVS